MGICFRRGVRGRPSKYAERNKLQREVGIGGRAAANGRSIAF